MFESAVTLLERLDPPGDDALVRERPLLAASGRFAMAYGGDLTRRFVESLPPQWHPPRVVVDSALDWLERDTALPGWRLFHRGAHFTPTGEWTGRPRLT